MTYCIALDTNLVVSTCPLQKGACLWQHRENNNCKYTVEEITVEEYCQSTGAVLDPTKLSIAMAELKTQLTR